MRTKKKELLAPYAMLLLAFGLRVYAADTAWFNIDQTHLHGQGIVLLDNLLHGRWSALPIFTYNSSSGLFNPALMEYVWALVAVLDRRILFGTLLNLIISTSGVAMLYALMRNVAGRRVALFAMLQMAISPWAIGIARGMWQPGQLEICFVLVSWLVLTGLVRARPRWVTAGFTVAAIVTWTYILTMGTIVFAGLASLIAYQHKLRRAIGFGWVICTASVALLFGLAVFSGKLPALSNFGARAGGSHSSGMPIADAFLRADRGTPLLELLRVNSDFDFIRTWATSATTSPIAFVQIGSFISLIGTGILLVLSGLGVLFTLNLLKQHHPRARLWVALWFWLAVPVAFFGLLNSRIADFQVQTYYLLMTAPVGYMIPALTLNEISRRWSQGIVSVFVAGACVIAVPFSIWNIGAAAKSARSQTYGGSLNFVSLRTAEGLGALWRQTGCEIMHWAEGINDSSWVVSLWQRSSPVLDKTIRVSDIAAAWQITPGKVNCLMLDDYRPSLDPYHKRKTLPDGSQVNLYTTNVETLRHPGKDLTVNLGWELLTLDTPSHIPLNQPFMVTHVWRINTLPNEPYAQWYFTPNIKLISNKGQVLGEYWGTAIEGMAWRVGDEIHSHIIVHAPKDIPAGNYRLQMTLFDPNQKKSAVYFSPETPAKPIVEINRELQIGS